MKRRLVPRRQYVARGESMVTISDSDMIRFSVALKEKSGSMLDVGKFLGISIDNGKKKLYIKMGEDFPVRKASSTMCGVTCYGILEEMEIELSEGEKSRRFEAKFRKDCVTVDFGN